jgi:hypothetical protein
MAMKETAGSLRAYFLVIGVIRLVIALVALRTVTISLASDAPPTSWDLSRSILLALHLVLGPAFLLAGGRIKQALPTGALWIKQIIVFAGAVSILELVLDGFSSSGPGAGLWTWAGAPICYYLYANVDRLAADAQRRVFDAHVTYN